ncbi:MAG: HD domain-containing protein, partial [Bacteroidales bacterium]|nr:HD domain-containing protein [Bacteroidales bacterium]
MISEAAGELGVKAYVVGGYVRDSFMGRECKDIDIVAVGSGIELANKVSENKGVTGGVKVFRNFGTAMLRYRDKDEYQLEFVGARKESYRRDSRKPVVESGTLEDDQNRRDFTINAMAIGLSKEEWGDFIDPFGGIRDLDNRLIRTPLDPGITFADDPLRMMRAVRFATQLDFTIDVNTFEGIKMNAERLGIISAERISEELNKIILSPKPSTGFKLLDESGLLNQFFPQLVALKGVEVIDGIGHKDNFYHTLKVLDNVAERSDDLWLRWAALLHDIAKPPTKKFDDKNGWTFHGHEFLGYKMIPSIFRQLKLPLNEKMKYVQKMVMLHLRPIALAEENVTDSAVRRLLFEAGDDTEDLMLLCEADITSKNVERKKKFLDNFRLVRE